MDAKETLAATETDTDAGPPTEVRTFLIADMRGYTRFTLEHGDEAAARLATRFANVSRDIVVGRGGQVIELRGDEALAVFPSARQALWAAVELQERVTGGSTDHAGLPLPMGIGLDAGEAIAVEGGYRGAALNLAARLCALAGAGETLASEGMIHLARKVEGLAYAERGMVQLKGFADPVRVIEIARSPAAQHDALRGSEPDPLLSAGPRTALEQAGQHLPIGSFLGALPVGPLVAREDELARILAAVEAVARGEGRLLLLTGEPGIGKTRLAQEATLALRNRGFLVAAGRCYEPQQTLPFYPFLDALEALFDAAPADIRDSAARQWPYLGQLLPDRVGIHPIASAQHQDDQQRLFRAVTDFLRAIARTIPVAALVDDLHWSDAASLDLLQHLARHTRSDRVFLLGTYRDMEVGRQHPLERALLDLEREGLVDRAVLHRLDGRGTADLIAETMGEARISDAFAQLVHGRTEGNPFFVQQVLRVMVEQGDVFREGSHWERREIEKIAVPQSVRAVIGQRLSRLAERTQEILREASVLGRRFSFDQLQRMAARSEDEFDEALEEATSAALIQEEGREGYAFDHALTQQTLYGELSARRKRRLHLAAGEALEGLSEVERDRRASELAWHFLQGDDPERALPYTLLAGDQAEAVYAHREAEWHYRTALELAREIGGTLREGEALENLGQVLRTTARYDEALAALEQAAEMSRIARDTDAECRLTARIGWVHAVRVTPQEGVVRLEATREGVADGEASPGLAALHAALAHLYFVTGRYPETLDSAQRAADLARTVSDECVLAQAEGRRAVALTMLGRSEEAIPVLEEVIPLAEKVGDLDTLCRALNNLGDKYLFRGEFTKVRPYYEQGEAVARRLGDPDQLAFLTAKVGVIAHCMGEWREAQTLAERARSLARSATSLWGAIAPFVFSGDLYTSMGRLEEAIGYLEEARTIAERSHDLQYLPFVQRLLGECDLLQGHPEVAISRLWPLLDRPDLPADTSGELATLAEGYLGTGDLDRALAMTQRAMALAHDHGNRWQLVSILRVCGLVLAYQDRQEEAVQCFDQAVSLARSMPYPYGVARAHYESGCLLARQGKSEQASRQLEEALAILRRLGAQLYVKRTEQALANPGTQE